LEKIFKLKIYSIISNYIYNNQNIKNILRENKNEDYNSIFEKILNKFDNESINNINKFNDEIKIYPHLFHVDFRKIKLDINNLVFIANNFINKKIFVLLQKNTMLIYSVGENKTKLELNLIFSFFDENSFKNCIKQIKEKGFDKYLNYYLLFNNNFVSPIFDKNSNQIGKAYRYISIINDYTQYNINFEIRKICLNIIKSVKKWTKKN